MFLDKIQQQQNFDEVEFISGYVMRLIKLTEQNIKLGKGTNGNKKKLVVIDYSRLPKL